VAETRGPIVQRRESRPGPASTASRDAEKQPTAYLQRTSMTLLGRSGRARGEGDPWARREAASAKVDSGSRRTASRGAAPTVARGSAVREPKNRGDGQFDDGSHAGRLVGELDRLCRCGDEGSWPVRRLVLKMAINRWSQRRVRGSDVLYTRGLFRTIVELR